MNASSSTSVLEETRVQARMLLKDLRSQDSERHERAASRFACLASLAGLSTAEIRDRRDAIRLKHALTVVALEHGYDGWEELRSDPGVRRLDEATLMYDRGFDVLLNHWFARYEQARESLETVGGWLLPYRHQFLVCESEAIRLLGLDPDDPDWERIGRDWVRPEDRAAWRRLRARRIRCVRERGD